MSRYDDMENTSAGGTDDQYLPNIPISKNRSLSVNLMKGKKSQIKGARNNSTRASDTKMDTVPLGNTKQGELGYADSKYDTSKWRKTLIAACNMVQQKVD